MFQVLGDIEEYVALAAWHSEDLACVTIEVRQTATTLAGIGGYGTREGSVPLTRQQ